MSFIAKLTDLENGIEFLPISKDGIAELTDTEDFEDFQEMLSQERCRLSAELATFRPELIGGFKTPQRKARCAQICLRLTQIDLALSDEE